MCDPCTTVRRTRFPNLGYRKDGSTLWRIVDTTDHNAGEIAPAIGPHYATRTELLADLPRYAADNGYDRE